MDQSATENVMELLWCSCRSSRFVLWQLSFARAAVEAESSSLLLLDDAGENLVFAAASGAKAEKYTGNEYSEALRVPMGSGIGMNPLAVFYSKDMSMEQPDPRHNPAIDRAVGTKTRSLYTIPIAADQRTIGTVSSINVHAHAVPDRADRFTSEDIEALHACSEAIGLWLEKQWRQLRGESPPLRSY